MAAYVAPFLTAVALAAAYCTFDLYNCRVREMKSSEIKGKFKELPADVKRKRGFGVVFAPQFDGLHSYETLISL